MAKERHVVKEHMDQKSKLPPPLPNGTYSIGSLGRFIDNITGDARRRRKAREELDAMFEWDDDVEAWLGSAE